MVRRATPPMRRMHAAACREVLLVAVSMGLVAPRASSELLVVDLFEPGDGLVTLDTVTELEWLDPTETTGLSAVQVLSGECGAHTSCPPNGWPLAGWRYATTSEVCALADQLGFVPDPCPGTISVFLIEEPFQDANFYHFLGITVINQPLFSQGLHGIYDDDDTDVARFGRLSLVSSYNVMFDRLEADLSVWDDATPAAQASTISGSLLVRRAGVVVPGLGPSAQLCLVASVVAMAVLRLSRRSDWRRPDPPALESTYDRFMLPSSVSARERSSPR